MPGITFVVRISSWNFARTKFQLEILIRITISAIHKFNENILESLWNVSETSPRVPAGPVTPDWFLEMSLLDGLIGKKENILPGATFMEINHR